MIALTITATLGSSVQLGAKNTAATFLSGLDFIPGRTLLGAAAWAWIDQGGNPESQDFKERFLSNDVSWGDLLPVPKSDTGHPVDGLPMVTPRTAMTCKLFGLRHGHQDTLLAKPDDLECSHIIDNQPCGVGLRRLDRVLVMDDQGARKYARPHKQHRTHLAIAFETGAARTGYLYSREVLQEGQVFRGRMHCTNPTVASMLRAELEEKLRLSVGSGRSRGYGQLQIQVKQDELPVLTEEELTLTSDQIATQRKLATGGQNVRYFTLTAGSSWFLRESDGSHARSLSKTRLARILDVADRQVEILTGEVRSETRSGWDGAAGLPIESRHLILAGSTFLCSITELRDADLSEKLNRLIGCGIGGGRTEGLGRVLVNHPLHFTFGGQSCLNQ